MDGYMCIGVLNLGQDSLIELLLVDYRLGVVGVSQYVGEALAA